MALMFAMPSHIENIIAGGRDLVSRFGASKAQLHIQIWSLKGKTMALQHPLVEGLVVLPMRNTIRVNNEKPQMASVGQNSIRRPLKTTFDMTTLIFSAGGVPLVPFLFL